MKQINKTDYKQHMEAAMKCTANRVYPMSIVSGIQKGNIYTDGKGSVLFWHYCGFAYISGNADSEFLEEIYQDFLISDMERRFLLITDSEDITDYYSDRDLLRLDKRIEYIHSGVSENITVPDDSFIFECITEENIGDISGRIIPSFSWESNNAFLKNGFGFIARSRKDGSYAAVAFSAAVSSEEVDIGVETVEAFRHHGLASFLTCKMCEKIFKQGRKPVWGHAKTNEGSRKTATSTGFKPCRVNTVILQKG